MDFKTTKTYKDLLKILKINLFFISIIAACEVFSSNQLNIIFFIMHVIIGAIIADFTFILPVSMLYPIFTAINEFINTNYKTPKILLKIIAINFFPLSILLIGGLIEGLHLQYKIGGIYEILYGYGIISWIWLLISVPFSIIILISAIVKDIMKKIKK